MNQVRLTASVEHHGGGRTTLFEAAITIAHPAAEAFAPLDRVSDPRTAFILQGNAVTDDMARPILQNREALARQIANTLTAQIIEAMGARDMENGYTRKEFT